MVVSARAGVLRPEWDKAPFALAAHPHRSAPHSPDCKRLHLSFGPSWAARSSGRAKTRILSGVRCRGCVRRAGSGRPRAHRRRPRPTTWVGGRESGGLRCRQLKPACARPSSARPSRLHSLHSPSPPNFATPLTLGAPSHHPFRTYRADPRSCPTHPGCKRLHLSFGPSCTVRSSGWAQSRILTGWWWFRAPCGLRPAPAASACIQVLSPIGGWLGRSSTIGTAYTTPPAPPWGGACHGYGTKSSPVG